MEGGDWDHELWGGNYPDKSWIDDVVPDKEQTIEGANTAICETLPDLPGCCRWALARHAQVPIG